MEREKKGKRERERETDRQTERRVGKGKTIEQNQKNLGGEGQGREKEKRRRIIVIKGADWNEGSNEETVKEFIKEKMKIEAEVERTHMIRVGDKNTIIVATIKSLEEKIRAMKKKSKLGKGLYRDDDLTRKEREVQQQIRRIGRVRREKGEYVRIGCKKLQIESRWYRWNENEERLEEERKRGEGK